MTPYRPDSGCIRYRKRLLPVMGTTSPTGTPQRTVKPPADPAGNCQEMALRALNGNVLKAAVTGSCHRLPGHNLLLRDDRPTSEQRWTIIANPPLVNGRNRRFS